MGENIYRILREHYKASGDKAAFEALESSPSSEAANERFSRTLAHELDSSHDLRLAIITARNTSTNSVNLTDTQASGGSTIAGRDAITTNTTKSNNTSRSHNTTTNHSQKSNYGGIAVAIVAVVVIVAILFIGRAILGGVKGAIAENSLSGTSTCAQYIASTNQNEKAKVMKDLYLKYNKPQQAADPFIIQNTDYICGNPNNQQVKLDRVAAKA